MIDITSTFVGVKIKNPIIIASSPLTESVDAILKCETSGAGAVISKSCSSTRTGEVGYRRCLIDKKGWWAASTFDREIQDVNKAVIYLREAVYKCNIPIFASVSELTLEPSKWISTCKAVQQTGVAGIQLDLFYFENVLGEPDFLGKFVKLLASLQTELQIPIFPKLNINLPTVLMAEIFKKAGISNISLLDSVSLPAPISVKANGAPMLRYTANIKKASLFGAWQYPLTLKYLCELKGEGFSICAGGGVQNPSDIVELILLGANAIQVATSVILNGYRTISEYIKGIEDYMLLNDLHSITEFQGKALSHSQGTAHYDKAYLCFDESKCIRRNKCIEQAFCTAISRNNEQLTISKHLCDACSLCVDLCPSKALHLELQDTL
jgi:dihydroorotate dehydrogenase